jgi:DNA mismatch repair ATPase MutS
MAGLPGSVVQRAAVVARQLKTRLGEQQQQQQQHQQPMGRQKQLENADASVLPAVQLTQQVCKVLQSARGSNTQLGDLLELQASAAQLSSELQHG